MKLHAKYDCTMGKCKHFIVGKIKDKISGGIYIHKDAEIPDEIVISFKKKEDTERGVA